MNSLKCNLCFLATVDDLKNMSINIVLPAPAMREEKGVESKQHH